jgi:hypothetical protein
MKATLVHPCGCEKCRSGEVHPDRAFHQQINVLASRLDERQRRWFIAFEAMHLGPGGARLLGQITGVNRHTIERGRRELEAGLTQCPTDRLRAPGGGRPAAEERDPKVLDALEALVAPETAGDPMGRRAKGKRSSLATLSTALTAAGHAVSRPTVSRLLRKLDYSPKVNARRSEARSSPADRDAQFKHIAVQRSRFQATRDPVISVDTKKKGTRR